MHLKFVMNFPTANRLPPVVILKPPGQTNALEARRSRARHRKRKRFRERTKAFFLGPHSFEVIVNSLLPGETASYGRLARPSALKSIIKIYLAESHSAASVRFIFLHGNSTF